MKYRVDDLSAEGLTVSWLDDAGGLVATIAYPLDLVTDESGAVLADAALDAWARTRWAIDVAPRLRRTAPDLAAARARLVGREVALAKIARQPSGGQ